MEASYSIVQRNNEYRVLLTSVNIEVLPESILKVLTSREIDISELMIERISGESTTGQDILHDITGWVAELFACNPNLIIYYSCDDMTPIPFSCNFQFYFLSLPRQLRKTGDIEESY